MAKEFQVKCKNRLIDGAEYEKRSCKDAIPFTVYPSSKLEPIRKYPGIFKFINWLPISEKTAEALISRIGIHSPYRIIKASKLGKRLGLKNLYIVNSGVGPTRTFKDLEALGVIGRWIEININETRIPVFASDGNFSRGVFVMSNGLGLKFVGIMTAKAIRKKMWHTSGYNESSVLVGITDGDPDYYDAIKLAGQVASKEPFIPEGGAKNIGRLDFVATILYESTLKLGQIPDHYFQAVGSGVGPIAIYQAAKRLVEDGRFGEAVPRIHIAQNYPFIPLVEAWRRRSKQIDRKYQEKPSAIKLISQVRVNVLTNRFPAYAVPGGLYDILRESSGEAYSVTNQEIEEAKRLIEREEGIQIGDASGVALASLIQAVNEGKVDPSDSIILHLTDGKYPEKREPIPPNILVPLETSPDEVIEKILQRLSVL